MTEDNILRRITLFPKDGKPFDEEGLMAYIEPMAELKLLPSVKKGVSFNLTDHGLEKSFSWGVDFEDLQGKVKVSVTVERVDILSTVYSSWDELMDVADKVIKIVEKNSKEGLTRLAVGYTVTKSQTEEEMKATLNMDKDMPMSPSLREKVEKTVLLEEMEAESTFDSLRYNNVHTVTYTRDGEKWRYSNDYDINTVVKSDYRVVTDSVKRFIETGIGILKTIG